MDNCDQSQAQSWKEKSLGTCQLCLTDSKSCHLHTADIVKNLHADLRKKYKQCKGNADVVWKEHCEKKDGLSTYASAMYHLATGHWSKKDETRIDWCRSTCLEYFFGGGLERILAKEQRRIMHKAQEVQTKNADSLVDINNGDVCKNSHDCSLLNVVLPPFKGKIRLLDVGSCYNPFKVFEQFITVGIDISPAIDSVIFCDFLSLEVTNCVHENSDTIKPFIKELKSPLLTIPSSIFQVVVFSLLLEYLPSPKQRWLCCQKANQLLTFNGILIIVTPDSHAQHKNAPMIKSWRTAIENLGFERWKYSKLEHLHCLAFRKVHVTHSLELDKDVDYDMLYIPQDFNEIEVDVVVTEPRVLSQEEENELLVTFAELPANFDF